MRPDRLCTQLRWEHPFGAALAQAWSHWHTARWVIANANLQASSLIVLLSFSPVLMSVPLAIALATHAVARPTGQQTSFPASVSCIPEGNNSWTPAISSHPPFSFQPSQCFSPLGYSLSTVDSGRWSGMPDSGRFFESERTPG